MTRNTILKRCCLFADGVKGDEPQRPNSLSSVEEMQGTLNYFSKTLLDPASLVKTSSGKVESPPPFSSAAQPWIAAAQKTLLAQSGMVVPSIMGDRSTGSPRNSSHNGIPEGSFKGNDIPIVVDGIEASIVLFEILILFIVKQANFVFSV